MMIRKLRRERGWSQEQLSELSGLSVRTIQRIERGQKPSLESLQSLAAVFDTDVRHLAPQEEAISSDPAKLTPEAQAVAYVRGVRDFYKHLITYALVMGGLLVINLINSPKYLWVAWPAMGWGIALVIQGLKAFRVINFFGPEWEKRQIKKRLDRDV